MHLALPGLSVRRKRHELVMNSEIRRGPERRDRKSTRLNSSHVRISYAVFCLKKKIDKEGGAVRIEITIVFIRFTRCYILEIFLEPSREISAHYHVTDFNLNICDIV